MSGIKRSDGRVLDGWEHVKQSLMDIWTTPKSTRVMRRDYGSSLLALMDRPGTYDVVLEAVMSAVEAERWEPRFRVREVTLESGGSDGMFGLVVSGIYYPRGHLGDYSVYEAIEAVPIRI